MKDCAGTEGNADTHATLAAVVGSSGDAIAGTTLGGVITSWNPAAERIFGYAAEEAVGRPLAMLLPPERREEVEEILVALQRGAPGNTLDTEGMRKDGRRLPIALSLTAVPGAAGRLLGAAAVARDVSGQRRLEAEWAAALAKERRAREAAETANHAKDAFLSMVSHELRTPLSPILTWAHMLRQGGLGEEKMERALEAIERNAHAQAQLVDDLLDVSRIVTGRLRLDVRPMAIATAVEAAVDRVREEAAEKRLRIETALDPAVGRIAGDAARLQQVVRNLLVNAVKASRPGGSIFVALDADETRVRIRVRDEGQGIDPGIERGSRAARRQRGLGIGLAIVRHLVEMHGGGVAVESGGEGGGATFTVTLPRRIWPEPASP